MSERFVVVQYRHAWQRPTPRGAAELATSSVRHCSGKTWHWTVYRFARSQVAGHFVEALLKTTLKCERFATLEEAEAAASDASLLTFVGVGSTFGQ